MKNIVCLTVDDFIKTFKKDPVNLPDMVFPKPEMFYSLFEAIKDSPDEDLQALTAYLCYTEKGNSGNARQGYDMIQKGLKEKKGIYYAITFSCMEFDQKRIKDDGLDDIVAQGDSEEYEPRVESIYDYLLGPLNPHGDGSMEIEPDLAYFYGEGLAQIGENVKATQMLQVALNGKYRRKALMLLCELLLNKKLDTYNPEKGLEYARQGDKEGIEKCTDNLAFAYLEGKGIEKDEAKGVALLEKIAAGEDAEERNIALYNLGNYFYYLKKDGDGKVKGLSYYDLLPQDDDFPAAWKALGDSYFSGINNRPFDLTLARQYYGKLAETHPMFYSDYGMTFDSFTPEGRKQSLDAFLKGAKHTNDPRFYLLAARALTLGSQDPEDFRQALEYLKIARENKKTLSSLDQKGLLCLAGICYLSGPDDIKSLLKAVYLFTASKEDSLDAGALLAYMMECKVLDYDREYYERYMERGLTGNSPYATVAMISSYFLGVLMGLTKDKTRGDNFLRHLRYQMQSGLLPAGYLYDLGQMANHPADSKIRESSLADLRQHFKNIPWVIELVDGISKSEPQTKEWVDLMKKAVDNACLLLKPLKDIRSVKVVKGFDSLTDDDFYDLLINWDDGFNNLGYLKEDFINILKDRAEKGDYRASHIVSLCYLKPCGVRRDYKAALKYAGIAAESKEDSYLEALGDCYFFGIKGNDKALGVYQQIKAPNEETICKIAYCRDKGWGTMKDSSNAIITLNNYAEKKVGIASYLLGNHYYDLKLYAQAYKCYEKAFNDGYLLASGKEMKALVRDDKLEYLEFSKKFNAVAEHCSLAYDKNSFDLDVFKALYVCLKTRENGKNLLLTAKAKLSKEEFRNFKLFIKKLLFTAKKILRRAKKDFERALEQKDEEEYLTDGE